MQPSVNRGAFGWGYMTFSGHLPSPRNEDSPRRRSWRVFPKRISRWGWRIGRSIDIVPNGDGIELPHLLGVPRLQTSLEGVEQGRRPGGALRRGTHQTGEPKPRRRAIGIIAATVIAAEVGQADAGSAGVGVVALIGRSKTFTPKGRYDLLPAQQHGLNRGCLSSLVHQVGKAEYLKLVGGPRGANVGVGVGIPHACVLLVIHVQGRARPGVLARDVLAGLV